MKHHNPPTHRVINGYQFPYYSGSLVDCRKVIDGMPDVFKLVCIADGSELPRKEPAQGAPGRP